MPISQKISIKKSCSAGWYDFPALSLLFFQHFLSFFTLSPKISIKKSCSAGWYDFPALSLLFFQHFLSFFTLSPKNLHKKSCSAGWYAFPALSLLFFQDFLPFFTSSSKTSIKKSCSAGWYAFPALPLLFFQDFLPLFTSSPKISKKNPAPQHGTLFLRCLFCFSNTSFLCIPFCIPFGDFLLYFFLFLYVKHVCTLFIPRLLRAPARTKPLPNSVVTPLAGFVLALSFFICLIF